MKQRFLLLVSLICLSSLMNLWAVPAYPGWQDIEQPDGSIIELRHVGDEFYDFWLNRDGQEVIQNDEGWWVVKPEQLTSAQRRARRAASPMFKEESALRKANVIKPTKLLVILVNFKDVKMQNGHDSIFFDEMLNGDNHQPYGSVREYFRTTSDGQYNPHWDVWGPVTLDSALAYYGQNGKNDDGSINRDVYCRQMAYQACQKADARGCDFTQYDSDNNDYVDNVYIIYAGHPESSCASHPEYIWPHAYGMKTSWARIDGKILYRYGCSSELTGCSGTEGDGIATFCHEFSHVIGMPDYYDTNYEYNYKNDMTPGNWSLMDGGSYNGDGHQPPLYSIFDKLYMGWATMPELLPKESAQNVTMPVGTQYTRYITGGTTAKAYTSTDTIYYLENRQQTGNFDSALPGNGLLIWRVIYSKKQWEDGVVNSTEKVLRYTLASATGLETGIGTKKDPYPGYNKVTSKNLLPGCQLTNITSSNGVISFKYNGGTDESYTHTWMAKGSTYKTSTSTSMLIFPNTNPSACSSTNTFYGWTEQTSVQKNGYGLELTQNYSTVGANKTFYAVYRSTTQPYSYSFLCSNSTVATSTVNEVYADGMRFNWHGKVFTQPGTYYDTVRTIAGDSIITLNLTKVHPRLSISYSAPEKLAEVTKPNAAGLHVNAFGQAIVCHSFSEGKGTIAFADTVRTIGDYAFYNCTEMDSITLPKRVTSIGDNAFYCCYALKYLKLNNSSITSIGDGAFYKCKGMTAISLPPAITRIGDRTFYYCSALTSLSIPAGVTTIDKYALGKCWGLTSLNLPESVTTLGDSALYNCKNLTKIKSYNTTPPSCGVNSFAEVPNTIPVYVWAIAEEAYKNDAKWQYFSNIRTFDCGDPAVRDTVRATVAAGQAYTFREKDYTASGIYMDTIITDAYGCDSNIYRLELVVLDSAKVIMYKAPQKLAEVTDINGYGLHVKKFGDQSIVVHTFIDSVGYIAFDDTLETIGYRAFYGCNTGNGSPVKEITLPNSITMIDAQAFYADFQLTSLTLPNTVTSIGGRAFHRCPFTSIVLPESVDTIGDEAFYQCESLRSVVSEALTPPLCGKTIFTGGSVDVANITLSVWPKAHTLYKAADQWKNLGDSVHKISCDHPSQIQSVYNTICQGESFEWFGKQYTETGVYDNLTMNQYGCDTTGYRLYLTVTPRYNFDTVAVFVTGHSYPWRERVLTAPGFYFDSLRTHDGCDSVYAFYLADSAQVIIYGANNKLPEVTDGKAYGLHVNAFGQPIATHTFSNEVGMVVFGDTLRTIGDNAFYACRQGLISSLLTVTIPNTVTSIGTNAFSNCWELTSVNIPEGVTTIGGSAFYKCYALANITCEALKIPSCGANCFSNVPTSSKIHVWPISCENYKTTSPWSTFDVQKITCDHPYQLKTTRDTICQGETYTWRGKQYTTKGTRRDTVTNKYGCDSVCYRLILTVNPTYLIESSATIVESQTYEWRDTVLTTSGIYYDSLKTKLGCDSVYKLTLNVIPANRVIIYEAANKLTEITSKAQSASLGLHTYNFGQPMVSHTFDETTKIGYITFASPLTQIGDSAFYGCRSGNDGGGELKAITLPNTITKIGNAAFYFCRNLTSLTIPEGVTSIGNRGIFRCTGLQTLRCEALTPPTCGTQCCSLTVNATLYVWPKALASYQQNDTYWKTFFGDKIRKITCDEPERNDLTKDTICQGDSLLWLGKYYKESINKDSLYMNKYGCDTVHYRLELTVNPSYLIEENVTWVNGMTFPWHTQNLTTDGVYWDSLQTVAGCDSVYKLTLNFTDSTRAIIYTAAKKLKEVSTSKTTDYGLHTHVFGQPILSHAFANGVGVVAFNNPLTLVGDSAFYACNTNSEPLTGIILPKTVQSIKQLAFYACQQLAYLDIPDAVTNIEQLAFHGCRTLTTLTIPEGVEVLHYRAINACGGLTTLYLPESLDSLGQQALRQDSNLVSITCKALTPPRCGANCFQTMYPDREPKKILYVWPSALNAYKADENWNKFNVQPITCENIPNVDTTYATICPSDSTEWRGKYYSAEGTYSDTLKNIYGCDSEIHRLILSHYPAYVIPEAATFVNGLTYVWHGKNLTEAGVYRDTLPTIHGCDSVFELTLTMTDSTKAIIYTAPAKLDETPIVISGTKLGLRVNAFGQPIVSHSFSNGIGVLAFENDLTQVGDTAFYGCRNTNGLRVNTITVPNTVTSIGEYAFYNCRNLTAVNIPSGVTSIGQAAFVRCDELSSIVLPEGITVLKYHAIYQCFALTSLTIPSSVDSLGKEAIASNTGLTSLRVEAVHPPKCGKDCFKGITTTIPVSVWPMGFTEYQNSTPWQYFSTFQKIACDQPLSRDTTRATIGEGEVYEWLGKQYSKAGNYDSLTTNEFGCDTVMARLELKVTPFTPEPGSFFSETFSTLNPSSSWNNPQKDTIMRGDNGVYEWHVKRYQRGGDDNLIDGEAGTRYAANVNSYVETNGIQEGGVKYVLFNWRCPGTDTYNITIQTDVTNSASQIVSRVVDEKGVQGGAQSCKFVGKYEVKENAKIRIKETAGGQSVIISPVRIIPYLLYKNRNVSLSAKQVADAGYKYKNTDIINNTGVKLDKGAITYTISGENNDKIAKLNARTGELTIIGGGTVTVTAKWGKVTTSYNLTIAKLTPTISAFSNTTVDLFGTYAPAPVCKIGNEVISDAAYTYSSGNTDVVTVSGQNFTLLKPGTSVITAKLTGTDYYNKVNATCTLTVVEPTDATKYWKEKFDTVPEVNSYATYGTTAYKGNGNDAVYKWQIRYFTHNDNDKVKNSQGVSEQGIRLAYNQDGNNYIAFDGAQEGGVKSVFFNWRLPGSGTADHVYFNIILKKDTLDRASFTNVTCGSAVSYGYKYDFGEAGKSNKQFQIRIPTAGQPVIFGPITFVPYLLYTQKNVTVPFSSEPYIHPMINNTDGEGTIKYTLSGTNPDKFSIDSVTGAVSMLGAGTATITATWSKGATTSYTITTNGSNAKMETFKNKTDGGGYVSSVETKKERLSDWTFLYGGVDENMGNFSSTAAALRAPKSTEEGTAFMESAKISGGLQKLAFLWNLNGKESNVNWDIRVFVNGRLVKTLTNDDITATNKMTKPQSMVIDNINQRGQFVLRLENHSTLKDGGAISDNKARFIMDNFEYFPYDEALVLDENDLNTDKIAEYEDNPIKIQLIRTLYTGRYNTICLPFDVAADEMETYFREGYELHDLYKVTSDNGIVIYFTPTDKGIKAGTPYLLEVAEDVVNPLFTNRTITETTAGSVTKDKVTFQGVYCQTLLHASGSPIEYFLASNNVLYRPVVDENMKGLRAYFQVGTSAPIRMVVNQPHTPTELEVQNAECTMHNGKFIKDNQLIILRDGKTYNAQGQLLNQ